MITEAGDIESKNRAIIDGLADAYRVSHPNFASGVKFMRDGLSVSIDIPQQFLNRNGHFDTPLFPHVVSVDNVVIARQDPVEGIKTVEIKDCVVLIAHAGIKNGHWVFASGNSVIETVRALEEQDIYVELIECCVDSKDGSILVANEDTKFLDDRGIVYILPGEKGMSSKTLNQNGSLELFLHDSPDSVYKYLDALAEAKAKHHLLSSISIEKNNN